jgi:cytoskeletal protein CcmA (bactofilin family)
MRSRADRTLRAGILLVALVGLFAVPGVAHAETTQSDLVLIRAEDVVSEDLFAAGNTIQVSGTIQGDLMASSMGDLRIDGIVEGDVTAIASRVVIAGVVQGSVRVVAPEVVVEGTVGDDLAAAGLDVTVTSTGEVGRDLLLASWSTEVAGDIDRNVTGIVRSLSLAGHIAHNVDVDVHDLTVADSARVDGDLRYRSDEEADIASGADVVGSIIDRKELSPNVSVIGLELLVKLLAITFGAAMGLAMIWSVGMRAVNAGRAVTERPIAVVGQGLGIVAIPLILVGGIVAAVAYLPGESVFPLLLAAIPFLLAVLGALLLFALVTPVPPAMALGRYIARRRSPYGQFLIGFLMLAVATFIPVIGSFVLVAVLVVGIGGWITKGSPHDPNSQPVESDEASQDLAKTSSENH